MHSSLGDSFIHTSLGQTFIPMTFVTGEFVAGTFVLLGHWSLEHLSLGRLSLGHLFYWDICFTGTYVLLGHQSPGTMVLGTPIPWDTCPLGHPSHNDLPCLSFLPLQHLTAFSRSVTLWSDRSVYKNTSLLWLSPNVTHVSGIRIFLIFFCLPYLSYLTRTALR